MQMLRHTKTLGIIQVEEKDEIGRICDEKLEEYFARIKR